VGVQEVCRTALGSTGARLTAGQERCVTRPGQTGQEVEEKSKEVEYQFLHQFDFLKFLVIISTELTLISVQAYAPVCCCCWQ
jgi:hypothetical protein